ncbi:unnamed protein product [Closterium sp. NIES-53]
MYITLYFIVTRLPDSLSAVRDLFLAMDPTDLTVDLLEKHLLTAEASIVAVGAARGTPRAPFFEGCSPSPLAPSFASATAVDFHATELPRWLELLRQGVDIFALDYDAILAAMYALTVSADGECYLCVPPDPGIEAAALGASESALPGTAPAEALHTFTLDSCASRCFFHDSTKVTPLPAPVAVRLADPSGGPVLARSSTVLPCPAVLSGSLSGLHLPSFSTNLVSTAALQDAMVTTTTPEGQRVSICACVRVRSGSSPLLVSPPVAPDSPVAPPPWSPLPATPSWPALPPPCLWSSGLCLPSHPRLPLPAFPVLRGGSAPLLTPPCFPRRLLPCRLSSCTFCLQLCERFREDLPVLLLHSDRGGEFASDLLWEFCRGEGIRQWFTLPASAQQNGVAECRIGLVMEVARTSMIHAAAPHFMWPFAVRYPAHQLNLCPVSPCWRPRLHCVGWGRLAMRRCSGSGVLVPLSAIPPQTSSPPAPFPVSSLSFPLTRLAGNFTTLPCALSCPLMTSRLTSRFPFTISSPTALPLSLPPPPLFLAPGLPPVDPLPPQGHAPSGVSQVDPLSLAKPVEVGVNSGDAGGGAARGAASGGAEPERAEPGGVELGVAESECAEPEGADLERAEPGGAEPEGVEPGGTESGGAEPGDPVSAGGPTGASSQREPLSPPQLRKWFSRCTRLWSGTAGAGRAAAGGTGAASVTIAS